MSVSHSRGCQGSLIVKAVMSELAKILPIVMQPVFADRDPLVVIQPVLADRDPLANFFSDIL